MAKMIDQVVSTCPWNTTEGVVTETHVQVYYEALVRGSDNPERDAGLGPISGRRADRVHQALRKAGLIHFNKKWCLGAKETS